MEVQKNSEEPEQRFREKRIFINTGNREEWMWGKHSLGETELTLSVLIYTPLASTHFPKCCIKAIDFRNASPTHPFRVNVKSFETNDGFLWNKKWLLQSLSNSNSTRKHNVVIWNHMRQCLWLWGKKETLNPYIKIFILLWLFPPWILMGIKPWTPCCQVHQHPWWTEMGC